MYLFTFILLAFGIFIYKQYLTYKNYPPGPINLPIIGSLYLIKKGEPQASLLELYKKYGKIYALNFGSVYTVVLGETEVIHEAFLKHSCVFMNRYVVPSLTAIGTKNIGCTNGVYWRKVREFVNKSFSRTKVRKFESDMDAEFSRMEQAIKDEIEDSNGMVSMRPFLKRFSHNIICNFLFLTHEPYKDSELKNDVKEFIDTYSILLSKIACGNPGDFIPFLRPFFKKDLEDIHELVQTLLKYTRKYVVEHKKSFDPNNPKDYVDLLMLELRNDPEKIIDEDFIENICVDLFVAGSETTASSLEWLIVYLSNYPETQERLYQELNQFYVSNGGRDPTFSEKNKFPYLNAVIKEGLRMSPPVPLGFPHECTEETKIAGYTIPKGAQVIGNIYSASLGPEHIWENPHTFNPQRFLDEPIPTQPPAFSCGPRHCPGTNLADDELFKVASRLFRTFKFERPTSDLIDESAEAPGSTLKPHQFKSKVLKR
eukprot:gene5924-7375_t